MTTALVTPKLAGRLAKLCGLFSSDQIGERAEAARQADTLLRRQGLRWHDVLVRPAAEWQAMALFCREQSHQMSDRERDFISTIARLRHPPSNKQHEWLVAIYLRLSGEPEGRWR